MTDIRTVRRRTTRTGAVAAPPALLLALLLASTGCGSEGGSGEDGSGADTNGAPTTQTSEGSTTRLRLSEAPGRCMAPNVRVLRAQEVAFEGTVTGIDGADVTLEVSRWYAGEETDLAVVQAPAEGMVALGYGTELVQGEDYLVSATDGEVTLCGFTGPVSDRLEALYAKAYER